MEPEDFRRWRKSLGLSQKDAAHALGLKRRVVQYYEKGERDGKDLEIPRYVRLACAALTAGIRDFHGPPGSVGEKDLPKKVRKGAKKAAKDGREEPKTDTTDTTAAVVMAPEAAEAAIYDSDDEEDVVDVVVKADGPVEGADTA
ncbi:helix-turn-helix transcriptional regulator [Marivibrio halodurans]|uniref:Helix-turn-helix transcriptional regulator n=1 Tax=Marivibrio halodurans TaxID=2039722 RepID=A0A8J7S4C6_9PROT|nr:helix-turn-helix transcriptional regulator [Marivibrio halodurans]MBP5856494.1 helix-turn-helix transcriptional regulator [Marivibrio halodurans]